MEEKKFLILLFYYERPEMIKNALQTIIDLDYSNYQVAFIDDSSVVCGKKVCESFLPPNILEKFKFYNTNQTLEEKKQQSIGRQYGGSIFGKIANDAIIESDAEYGIMVCDDDAIVPSYLKTLNDYFTSNPNVAYCYSKVYFYDPSKESYKESKPTSDCYDGGAYNVINNHNGLIYPVAQLDASQVCWNLLCNKQGNVWFPYPRTVALDMDLYNQLYSKYGACHPTNTYGEYKGLFKDQLGNRWAADKNAEYTVDIK